MSGESSPKKVKVPRLDADAERLAKIADAQQLFLGTALNMSWQLAITIIVPVLIGVALDKHFHSSPSYTLASLFLAVFMAGAVVAKTVKSVNQQTASKPRKGAKRSAK